VILNGVIAAVAVVLAVSLIRDLTHSRPIPASGGARARGPAGPADAAASAPTLPAESLSGYNVVVAKYLFNQNRSEGAPAQAAPAVPLPPKPLLMGVVVDGGRSRAYLEDPSTKRVFSYQIGDSVAGGKLEEIKGDKVTIARSDGTMAVMLHDPSKPKPVEAAGGAPSAPGRGAATQGGAPTPPVARQGGAPGSGSTLPASPQSALRNLQQPESSVPVPGRPPIAPRMLRRLPPEAPPQGAGQ